MIVARVRRTIAERGLLSRGEHVLVACSGGPDSAALLWALSRLSSELSLRLSAASVDHGLRPDAAEDVALARAQAASLAVPFYPLTVSLAPGPDLQARARDARYRSLRAQAAELGAGAIAVGHTLDDQAETVLMRLLRGAAVPGLGGVSPRRADGVVRPLLDCRREEVHACAQARFSAIARDPSNRAERFLRTRVRAAVLPALRAEDPRAEVHLAELADDIRDVGQLLETLASSLLSTAGTPAGQLELGPLREAPPALQRAALRAWAEARSGEPPGRAVQRELAQLLRGRGEVWLPGGGLAHVADGRICYRPAGAEPSSAGALDVGSSGAKVCPD